MEIVLLSKLTVQTLIRLLHMEQSDQGLHSFLGHICPNAEGLNVTHSLSWSPKYLKSTMLLPNERKDLLFWLVSNLNSLLGPC